MKPEYKSFALELKEASDDGIIEGYASTFGNIDLGLDIVERGAFKKTLNENKGIIPILHNHWPEKQIGWNLSAKETSEGLQVRGKIDLVTQLGRECYSLAKTAIEIGGKMGLSIGYGVIKSEPDTENGRIRRLKELKLYEYSIVTFPMNTQAMVTAAKSWSERFDQPTAKNMLETFINEAKSRGIAPGEIRQALLMGAADPEMVDPSNAAQSIETLISKIRANT